MSCRLLLSLILFIAGCLHLLYPQAFYPAIPFSQKFAINLIAGLFEIVLALFLWTSRFRDLAAKLSARWFFSLPYRWIKLTFNLNPTYHFTSPDLDLLAKIEPQLEQSPFDVWASERYALFTKRGDDTYVGEVQHAKWKLQSVKVMQLRDSFSQFFSIDLNHEQFIGATYSAQIDVKFKPFRQVI